MLRGGELLLVQLSDIHASPVMTRSALARMVARVNAIEADLVLITGDFVMPFSEEEHSFLIEELARIIRVETGRTRGDDLLDKRRNRTGE